MSVDPNMIWGAPEPPAYGEVGPLHLYTHLCADLEMLDRPRAEACAQFAYELEATIKEFRQKATEYFVMWYADGGKVPHP